jgi:hypothetical protein
MESGDDLTFDKQDSAPYMPRSVVVDPNFNWQGDPKGRFVPWDHTILYEMHVKGFVWRDDYGVHQTTLPTLRAPSFFLTTTWLSHRRVPVVSAPSMSKDIIKAQCRSPPRRSAAWFIAR